MNFDLVRNDVSDVEHASATFGPGAVPAQYSAAPFAPFSKTAFVGHIVRAGHTAHRTPAGPPADAVRCAG